VDGRVLTGTAAFALKDDVAGLAYEIVCDDDWNTKRAHVIGYVGARRIDVRVDESDIRALGCIDIDLNFSPSTNTLPIRRLKLAVGETARVAAAWLRFPSFALERLDQAYARLSENTYRYDNAASGFTAELRVNDDGLVLEYGDLWRAEDVS